MWGNSMKQKESEPEGKIIDEYFTELKQSIDNIDRSSILQAIHMLIRTYVRKRRIYVIGNGGSASTASHMACDLSKGTLRYDVRNGGRMKVSSLVDATAYTTAIANDMSYEHIFSEQLRGVLEQGDTVVALSVSGNSPNIIEAVALAKQMKIQTIGLLGFRTGGKLAKMVDCAIIVDSDDYGRCEDVHLMVNHIFTDWIARNKKEIDKQ